MVGALVFALALGATGCCAFSSPRYRGPVSRNFDGERFHNQSGAQPGTMSDLLRWQLDRKRGPWREWTDAAPGPAPPERVADGELRVTFVGHSTLLVQLDGLNVLTDPIWSDRASPVGFAGPSRVRPPGIRFQDLPPIDVVLISHNHYDHLDMATLKRLHETHQPRVFVGLGVRELLRREGITQVTEMDWWTRAPLRDGVVLHSVPAQHFSNRGACDQNLSLWTGFVLQADSGSVYFAGDTGFGPHFAQIRRRLGAPRLALLPIGAYRPRWFMSAVHVSPEEAVRAHQQLGALRSVATHFGTFQLADDGQDEPVEELAEALKKSGVPSDHFWVLGFGEGRAVPARP
jgi:L-ascorbate metabolism protein UlaG (beta-lactamase superfamily)